jgi:hypothetical protein
MSGALAQVTDRLYADLPTHATLRQVIAVVRRCADELDTPSQDAVPELVERLARQRLTDLATTTHLLSSCDNDPRGHSQRPVPGRRDNHAFAGFNKIRIDDAGEPNPDDLHLAWASGARVFRLVPQ